MSINSESTRMHKEIATLDGNEAAALVAYATNEVIAIYPITPSSAMGEWADQWASEGKLNLWGEVPRIVEMQSEAGAAGTLHGALQGGVLATTFTASQGLLLMIPNLYKIAGELTPAVIHVAARSVATHALSIFGDHSDVMAARATGWGMLASSSVQEAHDFALISQAATLESRIPFIHFFDGFRTSHEVMKIDILSLNQVRSMIKDELVHAHRQRSLSPDHPVLRGSAQNPDVYFQGREAVNLYYQVTPAIVQGVMDRFAGLTGRAYHLFDYYGDPEAERVLVLMGSGCETAQETVEALVKRGEKVGVLKVRLFRPFSTEAFAEALPETVEAIAVLDRTKEPGSIGEPLYLDAIAALKERRDLRVRQIIGGRYGLSSKEFTPAMIQSVLNELKKEKPKNHFTVGINDDLTYTSLDYNPMFSTEEPGTIRALFYGLGSDGTVGANKNSIKIIGEQTDLFAQGYFVYDSKKSGSITTSHLRFGNRPIHSAYLISRANFIACHQFSFLERMPVLKAAEDRAVFLLNCPYGPDKVWPYIPASIQKEIIGKKLRFFVIDASRVAKESGLGGRINTVLQTCFFHISGVLDREKAVEAIKSSIQKTYGKRGEAVVKKNLDAVDQALLHLHEVKVPAMADEENRVSGSVLADAPLFVQRVTARMLEQAGDDLPVSAFPSDGTFPTATSQWEKRNIAAEIPIWDQELCIQCGKCVLVCPHAAIRAKVYDPQKLNDAPESWRSSPARWREYDSRLYTLQVAPEDCTGCRLCVEVCPIQHNSAPEHKALNMHAQPPLRIQEAKNWEYFLSLPDLERCQVSSSSVKNIQLLRPLFEFSGACAGCGEAPYIKLMTQLFGDRMVIANATGCSSIFGGNLPTTPYTVDSHGRGPAWSNSLFEDNAEFGLGIRLAVEQREQYARRLVQQLASEIGSELAEALLNNPQVTDAEIEAQQSRVRMLQDKLQPLKHPLVRDLLATSDCLIKKSIWIVGGDGWAYDIGFGGLDHVLSTGKKVNVLVLDTEVYSNTGGQMSKATPRGAVAKFASGGKTAAKKDLAMMFINYRNVYVARIAMGGNDTQTVKAFREAEAFNGPSIILAYAHCVAHGYDMSQGLKQQKAAVISGYWPLFRYNPDLVQQGKNPMQLDSKAPALPLADYVSKESRYTMLNLTHPEAAEHLLQEAQKDVWERWKVYENLAKSAVQDPASSAKK